MPGWFQQLNSFVLSAYRQARRLVVFVIGATVILFGVLLIFLPGPAVVVIPLGLGILALEFAWARRWLRRLQSTATAAVQAAREYGAERVSSATPETPSVEPPPAPDQIASENSKR